MTDAAKPPNFSQFPFLWLTLCLAGGILAARFVNVSGLVWLAFALAAAISTVFYLWRQKFRIAANLILLAFAFGGGLFFQIEREWVKPTRVSRIYDAGEINFQTPIEITGALRNEPEETPDGFFLTVAAEKIFFNQTEKPVTGAVRLFLPVRGATERENFENLALRYGARIRAQTKITRENRYRNAGAADFRRILAAQNLDASGTIRAVQNVERLTDAPVFPPLAWLYAWRAQFIRKFKTHFSPQSTGVLAASLLNNDHFLDQPTAERFREGGTFHVLVISGVHITFIGLLIIWLVRKFTANVWAQFVCANVLLWAFAVAVGAEIPVLRAALMFTIFHAAVLFYRDSAPLNALGAAAFVLLVLRPQDLFDQSFHLTFLSVAAIVACAFPILERMRQIGAWQLSEKTPTPPACSKWFKTLCESLFWNETAWRRAQRHSTWKARLFKSNLPARLARSYLQTLWQFVFGSILISVVVTLWLLPLMAIYFHRFAPSSLVLNVFVGLLMASETFMAIAAILIAEISPTLAAPFIAWTELLNFVMTYSVEPFRNTSFASVRLPVYSGAGQTIYAVYFVPLVWLTVLINRWNPFEFQISDSKFQIKRMKTAVLLAFQCSLIALIFLHPWSDALTNGRLRVGFLDVGQGDAALVTTPRGVKILIDGGGRVNVAALKRAEAGEEAFVPNKQSVGETVVSEFLWENGVGRVDYLISTHADFDHIDGLNDAANNFTVGAAFAGRAPPKDFEFQRFAETLRTRRVPLEKISRGDALEIDGVRIEILFPFHTENADAPSNNNNSVVFRLTYGSRSFLFTGDIEAETERILTAQPENLISDVVKVAHHGSKTSSIENFVRATKAQFAVVSVGRESPYNHPHREVVERWQQEGAQVLTTGENGTITFSTDGVDLQVETFVGK